MKTYPSMNGADVAPKEPCYGFVKYDGTNFRAEFSLKRGWYKFGVRKRLVDKTDEVYAPAIDLFLEKYGDDLEKVFRNNKNYNSCRSFIVFGEYFGSESFAGMHKPCDQWDVVLFDVNPHKKGFISPKQFLDDFGHLKIAEVVHKGNLTESFIEKVRNSEVDFESKFEVKTKVPEGVVVKGGSGHNIWMAKIKSLKYKEALKELYEHDWMKYWE